MPGSPRSRKSQGQPGSHHASSQASAALARVLDDVAAPLDESAALGQRLLEMAAARLTPDQRRIAETIAETAASSAQRLRDYVDLMLLDAGKLVLCPTVCSIDDCIDEAVAQLGPATDVKASRLVVEAASRPSPAVEADAARVVQVLVNLIGNALTLTTRAQIVISTEPYDRSVAVHLVATEAPKKTFEYFLQGHSSIPCNRSEYSFGVELTRSLVIRLGGDLWASGTGTGSKLTFTVPRAGVPAGQTRSSAT